jgi:hypothetical protein
LEAFIVWFGSIAGSNDFLQLKIAIIEIANIAIKRKYFFIDIKFWFRKIMNFRGACVKIPECGSENRESSRGK